MPIAATLLKNNIPGSNAGEYATYYWAQKYNETGNPIDFTMGCFSSLWMPNTATLTVGILLTSYGIAKGPEVALGKNIRIAPFGNRTGNPRGELPHYHRKITDPETRETVPGGSMRWHRPWEKGW
jgi:hypothetical protein